MRSALAPFLFLCAAVAAVPADAALVCLRGKKVKLRSSAACKRGETLVADLGNDLSGIWKHREGDGLTRSDAPPAFLVLNPDGTGRINRRAPVNGVLSCRTLRYARGGGVPTLVLSENGNEPELLGAAVEGADVLRIIDDRGRTSIFDRATAVDPAADCPLLREVSRLTDVPLPSFATEGLALGSDGSFVYRDDAGGFVAVNASSGAPGTPPTLPSDFVPQASQGRSLLWGLQGDVAVRAATLNGAVIDEVRAVDLGEPPSLFCLAAERDGTQVLLLVGEGSSRPSRLLVVNTEAEPDTLLAGFDFVNAIQSLALDGNDLWGLAGDFVARIDPGTGLARATFLIPDTETNWRGIAANGGKIFLLGRVSDAKGVIATFTP